MTNQTPIGDGTTTVDRHWLNAERVRVYSWMILVMFSVGAVVWTALALPDLVEPRGKPVGYDFITFWSAAWLALQGRPAAAYDWSAISAAHRVAVPALNGIIFAWHYPPTYLLMILPLGLLPYLAALVAFLTATIGLWAGVLRQILPDRRTWIVAAAFPAGLINLIHGQNGFLTAAIAGAALLALQRQRQVLAGGLIALLAIKPHLAVLFPVALIAAGYRYALAAAAVATLAFAGVSIAAFGWPTVQAFLHDLPVVQQLIDNGVLPWGMMPSPYVFVLSLGGSATAALVLQVVVAIAAAICTWVAWRSPAAPFEAKAAVLVVGALLVSPYVFYYDMTWAGLGIAWLGVLGLQHGFVRGAREILLAAWLAPIVMTPFRGLTGIQIGFPVLVALLALAMREANCLAARPAIVTQARIDAVDPGARPAAPR